MKVRGGKASGILASTIVVLGSVAAFAIFFKPRPRIEDEAKNYIRAVLRGDGDVVYAGTFEEERSRAGVTRRNVQQVLDDLVLPRLRKFQPEGPIQTVVVPGASQAQVFQILRDDRGHRLECSFALNATPEGGKLRLMGVIMKAWYAEYVVAKGLPSTPRNIAIAYLQGIEADERKLKEIGILGNISGDPMDKKLYSFEELRSNLSETIAKYKS